MNLGTINPDYDVTIDHRFRRGHPVEFAWGRKARRATYPHPRSFRAGLWSAGAVAFKVVEKEKENSGEGSRFTYLRGLLARNTLRSLCYTERDPGPRIPLMTTPETKTKRAGGAKLIAAVDAYCRAKQDIADAEKVLALHRPALEAAAEKAGGVVNVGSHTLTLTEQARQSFNLQAAREKLGDALLPFTKTTTARVLRVT